MGASLPSPTTSRFRLILPNTYTTPTGEVEETEQEYVGEAQLTMQLEDSGLGFDIQTNAIDAHILAAWEVLPDGTHREVFQGSESREFWQALEVAAVDCFNRPYPVSWPIDLPTDPKAGEQAPGDYQTWIKIDGKDRKVWVVPAEGSAQIIDARSGDDLSSSVPGEARKKMWDDAYDEFMADLYQQESE